MILLLYKAMLRRGLTDLQCSRFSIELPPNQRIPDERMSIASRGHGPRGAFHKNFQCHLTADGVVVLRCRNLARPGVG